MSGLLGTTETYSDYVTASFNKVSANIVCLSLQPCLHWDYFAKVFWLLLQPAISQNCRGVRDPFSISGASLEWQWCVGKPLVYVSLLDTFRRCQLASQGTSSVVVKRSNSTMRISSSHAPAMGLIRNAVARVHMAGIGRGIVGSAKPSQSASSRQLPARLPAKTASQGVRSGCQGVGQRRRTTATSCRTAREPPKPIGRQRQTVGQPRRLVGRARSVGNVRVKAAATQKLAWKTSGPMHMTSAFRNLLDSWGPDYAKRLEDARRQWFQQNHFARVGVSGSQTKVKIGTDCSGAEAPIWAMKQMRLPHEHVFSCDWQGSVRTFTRATCPPTGPIFEDMLTRDRTKLPDMDVYVCGFPCTPFSSLRQHQSRLLREEAAKPFFEVLEVLRHKKPKLAVLENVLGIRQVMRKVLRYLRGLKFYWIIVLPIDSQDLGEPVARPRYFFLLVRRGVEVLKSAESIKSLAMTMAHAAHQPVTDHVASRMLVSDSPCVQQYLRSLRSAGRGVGEQTRRDVGEQTRRKWPEEHDAFRVAKRLRPGSVSVCLPTERMCSAYGLVKQHAGQDIVGDFSQSIGRVHPRTDGVCPTVTPKAVIHVDGRGVGRVVTPREKLLLHLFPLHKMQVPPDFLEEDLGTMGGNTMHLKSVGLALTIGLALTDFSCTASATSEDSASAPTVVELPLNTVRSGRS